MLTEDELVGWLESRGLSRKETQKRLDYSTRGLQRDLSASAPIAEWDSRRFWNHFLQLTMTHDAEELGWFARQHIRQTESSDTDQKTEALRYFPLWGGTTADLHRIVDGEDLGKIVGLCSALCADQLPPLPHELEMILRRFYSLPMVASIGTRDSQRPMDGPTYHGDDVISMRYGPSGQMTCGNTDRYFHWALDEDDHLPASLLRVNGVPVGFMKTYENDLVLGLVNVRDADGRYPLVRGGVYRLADEEQLLQLHASVSDERPHRVVDVERLFVYPQRRVRYGLDHSFYSHDTFKKIANSMVLEYSEPGCREGEEEGMVFRPVSRPSPSPLP